jgi:hypothetical protein
MKTAATEENCMGKLYTQSYRNLARNKENTTTSSTRVSEYSKAYYAKILMIPTVT